MSIVRGVPFLLQSGKRIGTAQLAGEKRTPFSISKISIVLSPHTVLRWNAS